MKSTITFDTLQFTNELKESGMRQEEAEAITKATQRAFVQMIEVKEIATKSDIKELEMRLQSFIIKSITTTVILLGGLQTLLHFFK
jgi:hypothetical protein